MPIPLDYNSMTDQNNPDNPEETVEEVVVLEDAEGTEVIETEEERIKAQAAEIAAALEEESPEYATPNAGLSDETPDEEAPARHATPNAASTLLNLETLINGYIVDL